MKRFLKKNVVFCVAFVAAVVTCFLVPPDAAYADYFDWKTLACLFLTLAVVCALRNIKFFTILARKLVLLSGSMRLLFLVLATVSVADGIFRLAGGISVPTVLCFLGGVAWLVLAFRGTFPPFMELLPLLQLGGLIVDYFRSTYKYIQISEYSLRLLGLCAMAYFALVLIKTMTGADCPKGRLITAACLLLIFGVVSFLAPLAGGFEWSKLLFAVHGFTYCLLAALTLIWLPEGKLSPATPIETPNPDTMNEYISDLPEIQEEDKDVL